MDGKDKESGTDLALYQSEQVKFRSTRSGPTSYWSTVCSEFTFKSELFKSETCLPLRATLV